MWSPCPVPPLVVTAYQSGCHRMVMDRSHLLRRRWLSYARCVPRADLVALFEMLRAAPRVDSIVEHGHLLETFAPFINPNAPAVGRIESGVRINAAVRADVLVPAGTPPFPTLLYLHGGGWSIGSPNTHAKLAAQHSVGARR